MATFTRDGDTRTVCFGDLTVPMRDLKGFHYLERLLADPGRELAVLDLAGAETGWLPTGPTVGHDDVVVRSGGVGAGLVMFDDEARRAHRRRLADVDEDIEEPTQIHDVRRLELAEADREHLIAELSRAVGLGGCARTTGGAAERARTSVTRSLRYALGRLDDHHPALAAHLDRCVHTGTDCRYAPDPLTPIEWHT